MGENKPSEQDYQSVENANGEDVVEISSDSASLINEDEPGESEETEESEKDPVEILQDDLKKKDDEIAERQLEDAPRRLRPPEKAITGKSSDSLPAEAGACLASDPRIHSDERPSEAAGGSA